MFNLLVSKLQQSCHGVGAWWEDEDERSAAVTVSKSIPQVKGGHLDKLGSQAFWHKLLDHGNDLEKDKEQKEEHVQMFSTHEVYETQRREMNVILSPCLVSDSVWPTFSEIVPAFPASLQEKVCDEDPM